MKKEDHALLEQLLCQLQIKSVEALLDVIRSGEATAAHLKAADDICKRHGIQFDPAELETEIKKTTLNDLPFTPSKEDFLVN